MLQAKRVSRKTEPRTSEKKCWGYLGRIVGCDGTNRILQHEHTSLPAKGRKYKKPGKTQKHSIHTGKLHRHTGPKRPHMAGMTAKHLCAKRVYQSSLKWEASAFKR